MAIFQIFIIIAALVALVFACDKMIIALSRIASGLHWKEFVLSFLLVAFATSAPEFFIGITSALGSKSSLSLGNIIGANSINATLIMGIAAIFGRKLPLPQGLGMREVVVSGIIALLPVILVFDGSLSRVDGIALLTVSIIYFLFIAEERKKHRKRMDHTPKSVILKAVAQFIFWTLALLLASQIVVWQSQELVATFDLSFFLVGFIIVALGTTLPEIVFTLRSSEKGATGVIYGNLLGTLVVNSGVILGTVSIISPIFPTNMRPVVLSGSMFFLSLVMLFSFINSDRKLVWSEGAVLIFVYLISLIGPYLIR